MCISTWVNGDKAYWAIDVWSNGCTTKLAYGEMGMGEMGIWNNEHKARGA